MVKITIEPATAHRWDDVEQALSGGGDGRHCQCQWWRMTNAQWQTSSIDERQALFRDELQAAFPPGLVAYVDGEAAGWVRVGPRTGQIRLGRTRHFTGSSQEPWDDSDVWAVTCFAVRKEHRGKGLNSALLAAAIDLARSHGARVVEAYPIDPAAGAKKKSNDLFHGVVSTFAAAGFTEVARPRPDLAVMTLSLTA